MKLLIVLLALFITLTSHAEVLVDQTTFESDWKADYLLKGGELYCPGGTLNLDGMGFPYCVGGKGGLHGRGTEFYSCTGGSDPYDPRVEGTLWMQTNANWFADYTGQGWGTWRAVPGDCNKDALINPEMYWEGSWQGRREIVGVEPTIWVYFIEIVGHGVGGELEGLKFSGTEELTLFTPMPVPYELMPWLNLTGPESIIHAEIKSKVKK